MSQPTNLVKNLETIPKVPASTSSSKENSQLPAATDTHSSAQAQTESASWGDWFMGILHSVLGWLCFCCPEKGDIKPDKKDEESNKPLPVIFEDPELNDFYYFIKKGEQEIEDGFSLKKAEKLEHFSPELREQIIRYALILEQVSTARKANDWPRRTSNPWRSPFLDLSHRTLPVMRLSLEWMAYKKEWTAFYRDFLPESSSISDIELRKGFAALSSESKRVLAEISENLRLEVMINPIIEELNLDCRVLSKEEVAIFQNFFKFLVGEEYDTHILLKSQRFWEKKIEKSDNPGAKDQV